MKELKLYREDNGQYSTSEAKQDDVSGAYVQRTDYDELRVEHYDSRAKVQDLEKENAELLTKLSNLVSSKSCATCNNSGVIDYDDGFGGVCSSPCHCTSNPYSTYSVVNILKIQSLADIKADAVIALTEQDYGYSVEIGGNTDEWVISVDQILEYANKLRGESK